MPAIEWRGHRLPGFGILLGGMLIELMFVPLLASPEGGLRVARTVTMVALLSGLPLVGIQRDSLLLLVPALTTQLLATHTHIPFMLTVAITFRILFIGYVLLRVLWFFLHEATVTLDTIAGSVCAFMLLGFLWAGMYQLVEHLAPQSFDIPSGWTIGPEKDPSLALTYFSFVTLTTVGYGDMRPARLAVGGLCVAEALVGQFYLAIMVARMVGLHLARRSG